MTTEKEIPKLLVANEQFVPSVLPIYRGIHICGSNFTEKFKKSLNLDSSLIASYIQSTTKFQADSTQGHALSIYSNKYLYPQKFNIRFNENETKEGRFSIMRAQTLMKLFYMSVVDPSD